MRLPLAALLVLALAGCGGGARSTASSASPAARTTSAPASASSGAGALQAEAAAAATGDVPDNQVFLRYDGPGWSIKYPEGWARRGSTFRDKNNIVRVVVRRGSLPTPAAIRRELQGSHVEQGPKPVTIAGSKGYKVVYTTESAPNPVTGKRVTLVVDRYVLAHAGRVAIVDLGTPRGVDNVDAYRLMIESFRWR
jgi:hypothetical protein